MSMIERFFRRTPTADSAHIYLNEQNPLNSRKLWVANRAREAAEVAVVAATLGPQHYRRLTDAGFAIERYGDQWMAVVYGDARLIHLRDRAVRRRVLAAFGIRVADMLELRGNTNPGLQTELDKLEPGINPNDGEWLRTNYLFGPDGKARKIIEMKKTLGWQIEPVLEAANVGHLRVEGMMYFRDDFNEADYSLTENRLHVMISGLKQLAITNSLQRWE